MKEEIINQNKEQFMELYEYYKKEGQSFEDFCYTELEQCEACGEWYYEEEAHMIGNEKICDYCFENGYGK